MSGVVDIFGPDDKLAVNFPHNPASRASRSSFWIKQSSDLDVKAPLVMASLATAAPLPADLPKTERHPGRDIVGGD
jgi:hypothetical protein